MTSTMKLAEGRKTRTPAKSLMLNDQRSPKAMQLLRRYAKLVGLPLQYAADHVLREVLPNRIALLKK